MTRIAVVGNAGGGKSVLCSALGRRLGIPVFSYDSIQYRPGWQSAPADEVERRHAEWIARPAWIVDGWGSAEQMERRIGAADTIVFVDLPVYRHYWWSLKRQAQYAFRPRPDLPENCPMLPMTMEMFKTIWVVHRRGIPWLRCLIETQGEGRTVVRLTSPKQITEFLQGVA